MLLLITLGDLHMSTLARSWTTIGYETIPPLLPTRNEAEIEVFMIILIILWSTCSHVLHYRAPYTQKLLQHYHESYVVLILICSIIRHMGMLQHCHKSYVILILIFSKTWHMARQVKETI